MDSSQKPSSDRTEPTKTGVKTSLGGTSQDADGERSGPPTLSGAEQWGAAVAATGLRWAPCMTSGNVPTEGPGARRSHPGRTGARALRLQGGRSLNGLGSF